MNGIVTAADGYPHFIQQFAYSAFDADVDFEIDMKDFTNGVFAEHGAFQQLGERFFSNQYFEEINSEDYRKVLRVMSEYIDGDNLLWVSKSDLRKKTQIKESSLANAIAALKKRGIIIADKTRNGFYKLPSRPFAVWLSLWRMQEVGSQKKADGG